MFISVQNILSCAYSAQVKMFVEGLFHLNNNIPAFKEHLRDFLVQIKVRCVCVCVCVCVGVN